MDMEHLMNSENPWRELANDELPVRLEEPEENKILRGNGLVAWKKPNSLASEQFRVLFTRIAPGTTSSSSYTVAVTSSVQEEGKSFTAMNLALTIARDFGHKVLLLEGDLKRPSLHTYLNGGQGFGLSDVIEGRTTPESCWITLCDGRLRVLTAGRMVDQPSRLLSSPAMSDFMQKMRESFRYIILDTPPILPMADMNIFSQWVDGILLVIRAGKTPRSIVKRAVGSLASEKIIGVILNDIQPAYAKYYYGPYYKE
jgi:capsular exopolysaccharide synthesis family protein